MWADLSLLPANSNPPTKHVRISVSLFECTYGNCVCVGVGCVCTQRWVIEQESDEDAMTLQQVMTCCGTKIKWLKIKIKKGIKKRDLTQRDLTLHKKRAKVGFIHLTSPSGCCLAADFSQFVFGGLKRKCCSVTLDRRLTCPLLGQSP